MISKIALCFAQALSKGANINRWVDTQKSLECAIQYHKRALTLRKKHLSTHAIEIAHSYVDLAATYNELKGSQNNVAAINYYNKGLAIYEKDSNNAMHVASTLHKLGNALRDLDEKNIPLVNTYYIRALNVFNTLPSDSLINREKAKVLYNLGVSYHHLDDESSINKAIEYFIAAKQLFEGNNDQARLTITLCYLGDVYRSLGN